MRFLTATADRPVAPARTRRGRRWSRRSVAALSAGAVMLAAAGAGWWAYRSGIVGAVASEAAQTLVQWSGHWGFAVTNVEVEGRDRVSREAILGALDVARGTPILSVDPVQAKRRLEEIPWVRSASVERRLPDTLYIRLVERVPLAFWQRQGKLVLIDRDGTVIPSERLDSFGSLIVLVGGDAPKEGAALIDMLATEPALASHVTAAVRVGGRRWNLRLDRNIDIALPEEDAASAWHRLAQLERSNGILERDVQMVDLRLPDRLVVRTPQEAQKTPPKKNRQTGKTL